MASKAKIKVDNSEVDGYVINDFLGLYLRESDKLWVGVHLPTGKVLEGLNGRWKKKRACMAFVESFINLDWNVETEEEMYEKNGGFDKMLELYGQAVEKAKELD